MRRIVVTGAAGGIGVATVSALSAEDTSLICVDVAADPLEELLTKTAALPGERRTCVSDLATAQAVREVAAQAGGPIAGLVHLAGVFEPDPQPLDDFEVYERAIEHNLSNAYRIANAVVEQLDSGGNNAMVFASSLAFRRGGLEHVPYSAAKGGIVGLVRALARRLAPGTRINAVAPGLIDTPMPAEILKRRGAELRAAIPLQRIGRPEEVASVIAFLMSEGASYITGQTINIDGGMINS